MVLILIQSDLYLAETNTTFKQQYAFKFYKYTFKQKQVQATRYFEVTKQYVAIFTLFFVDAIN